MLTTIKKYVTINYVLEEESMSHKPMKYEDRLRADFRKYLVRIACNKSDATLNEIEILKAFDLAVQKQKLTTLEAEMLFSKHPDKTSIFDISRAPAFEAYEKALNIIACWHDTPYENMHEDGSTGDYRHFDEPFSARLARDTLRKFAMSKE
jgi:hypothetical protein